MHAHINVYKIRIGKLISHCWKHRELESSGIYIDQGHRKLISSYWCKVVHPKEFRDSCESPLIRQPLIVLAISVSPWLMSGFETELLEMFFDLANSWPSRIHASSEESSMSVFLDNLVERLVQAKIFISSSSFPACPITWPLKFRFVPVSTSLSKSKDELSLSEGRSSAVEEWWWWYEYSSYKL